MIQRVISGGQTGADQGALRAARSGGYETGGWAPQGWRTDAGPAPWLADYGLKQHPSPQYKPRTIANVRMAHALIWIGDPTSPGGRLTMETSIICEIPSLGLKYPYGPSDADDLIRQFLAGLDATVRTLMIAGNRERINVGIEAFTERVLGEGLIPF